MRIFVLHFQSKSIFSKTDFALKTQFFFNFLFVLPDAFENYWKLFTFDTAPPPSTF